MAKLGGTRKKSSTRRAKKSKGATRRRAAPRKARMAALVKSVLSRQLETKYVAQQNELVGYIIPGDIVPNVDYHPLLPPVVQQPAQATSNTREGDKIEPMSARISGHIWYDNVDNPVGNIVHVKLFFCQSKVLKDTARLNLLPSGLLENGTADPVDWLAAGQDLQAFYPVNKDQYTVLKTMTFKLAKNGGLPIGNQPGHDTNIGRDRYAFSYSWKPPTLKYALDASIYPSNHAPFFFAVAYSPGYNYATDASIANSVAMNWNLEMRFKDA